MSQASGPVGEGPPSGSAGSATAATPTTPGYPQSPRQLPPLGYNNAGGPVGSQYPGSGTAEPNIYGNGQQGQMFNYNNYSREYPNSSTPAHISKANGQGEASFQGHGRLDSGVGLQSPSSADTSAQRRFS